ncbi:hypothetical protein PCURB6_14800 [Paenibacillus curdlanolyticus]|nr:hypothetical protein [Paenibacillus curdlanolyticus]GFN31220.1 hypothetical protein PCURB6_14800 [Paenibacillus curdlanolyticus]
MVSWMQGLTALEPVALAVLALLLGSLVHGLIKGASGSAKRLFFFVWDGILMLICIAAALKAASLLSPVASRLLGGVHLPNQEVGSLTQLWYTFVTSFRDFALFRYGVLLLICYAAFRWLLAYVTAPIERYVYRFGSRSGRGGK